MIEIRFSEGQDIELSGTLAELEELREVVLELLDGELSEVRVEADQMIDPAPWDSIGYGTIIRRAGDAARISIDSASRLIIEASGENLDNFASFLSFDETTDSGSHSHFEYYDGNDFIEPDSIPLILSVK
jgi:hypothetical protein